MEAITYRLDQFEGPLDLLLNLISKNKVSIADIPIAMICDQYMEYIVEAKELNMDIASEFIVMASELILIKSKMLLPRTEEDEEDPRATLADALLRYKQAKEAAVKLAPMYAYYSGRMVKDTDEISVDKTFVADQSPLALEKAIRQIIAANNALERAQQTAFKPMISKPVVPVELKIVGILKRMENGGGKSTLYAHLEYGKRLVQAGDYVEPGQVIGYVGLTGTTTGYHLHFETRINGATDNPRNHLTFP